MSWGNGPRRLYQPSYLIYLFSGDDLVVTGDPVSTRGGGVKPLKVDELSVNVNLFIEQMGNILEKTPEKLGKFHFEEFEVYAEITGKGTLAILGTGAEVGATGGLRFLFRRSSASGDGK